MSTPRIDRHERNLALNSGFHFNQRYAANPTSMTAGFAYFLDRFMCRYDFAGSWTGTPIASRSTDAPNSKTKYCLSLVGTPASGACQWDIAQRIEASEARALNGNKLSVSFWARTDNWATVTIEVYVPSAEDNFTSVSLVASSSSKTVTIDGVWNYITADGIDISGLDIQYGIEIRLKVTGAASTGSSKYFRVSQFMAIAGNVAVPWIMKEATVAQEFASCQRYYEKSYDPEVAPGTAIDGIVVSGRSQAVAGTRSIHTVFMKVAKRALPSVTFYNNSGSSASVTTIGATFGSVDLNYTRMGSFSADVTTSSSTAESAIQVEMHYTAASEL